MTSLKERPDVTPAGTSDGQRRRSQRPTSGTGGFGLFVRCFLLAVVLAVAIQGISITIGQEQWIAAAVIAAATLVVVAVYATGRAIPLKYLVPGILLMLMFQIFPVAYTFYTAFTNSSDGHTLSKEESIRSITVDGQILEQPGSPRYTLSVAVPSGSDPATADFVYLLTDPAGTVQKGDNDGLEPLPASEVTLTGGKVTAAEGYDILSGVQVNARSAEFDAFQVPAGDGEAVKKVGLSQALLGKMQYTYDQATDTITDTSNGKTYIARDASWVPADGQGPSLNPGWQQFVGFDNFTRIISDTTLRNSFLGILTWNIAFGALSVASTFALGLLLAVVLNRKLVGQRLTRSLLLLPYALPGFITALVWASMYNTDFGLINNLTGLHIDWLGDPFWAKAALLLTNLWLGFPYMFIVCTGALQSIPASLTEAATIDGASPWQAFRAVTLPMLLTAVAPLLVASFAFNFNNFALIYLLTRGGPFAPDNPQAGATDLLISYTYRLAFGGGGAQFGFAAAISIFIFIIVALMSVSTFRRTQALEENSQ